MSGGVDSSVAGHILLAQGYELVGVTLNLHSTATAKNAAEDAARVARQLGIEHHVLDESQAFDALVQQPFVREYHAGRTPSPCILCNRHIKFERLLRFADMLDCEFLATGHYAVTKHEAGGLGSPPALYRASDHTKDQSYFLFMLTPDMLARTLMPLGAMSKSEIRAIAKEIGLHVAEKPDSLDICFVPENNYIGFLRERVGELRGGEFVDTDGRVVGQHEGIEHFTVGQRRGLPGGGVVPRYVLGIDPETARVTVGPRDMLACTEFFINGLNWLDGEPRPVRGTLKVRNTSSPTGGTVTPLGDGRARVSLERVQHSITPGQAAVLYRGERLIGGGWIE